MITELIQKLPEKEQKKWLEALKEERKSWEEGLKGATNVLGVWEPPKDATGEEYLPVFESPDGKKWRILDASSAVGVRRFNIFSKLAISAGFGKTFSDLMKFLDKGQRMVVAPEDYETLKIKLVLYFEAFKDGILELSKSRFDVTQFMATVFIVPEGEQMPEWSEEYATKLMEQFESYNCSELFFFQLSLSRIGGFGKTWNLLREKKKKNQKPTNTVDGFGTQREEPTSPSTE